MRECLGCTAEQPSSHLVSGPRTSAPQCAKSAGCRCLWNCCSLRLTRWCAPSPLPCATSRWTGATKTLSVRMPAKPCLDTELCLQLWGPIGGAWRMSGLGVQAPTLSFGRCPTLGSSRPPGPVSEAQRPARMVPCGGLQGLSWQRPWHSRDPCSFLEGWGRVVS